MGEQERVLLTRGEVAARLGVSVQTVGRLINSDALKSIRISPRGIRVTNESFVAFIKSRSNSEVSSEQQ